MTVSRLSPSSIGTWYQCQRRFRFRYVDHLPDPPGVAAVLGTFVHKALELLYEAEPARRGRPEAIDATRTAWRWTAAHRDYRSLELSDADRLELQREGWGLVQQALVLERADWVDVVATERRVTVELAGVPFTGVIDRTDEVPETGERVIVDYKTGKPKDPDFRQLLLYAVASDALYGPVPTRLRFVMLRGGLVGGRLDPGSAAGVLRYLERTWAAVQLAGDADEYRAQTGPLCAWCPYVDRCSEGAADVRRRARRGKVRADAPGLELLGIGA